MKLQAPNSIVAVILCVIAFLLPKLGAQTLNYQTSWAGNSLAFYHKNVLHDIDALYVDTSGTCFVEGIGNDGGSNLHIYSNGAFVNYVQGPATNGGFAITADSTYIYAGCEQDGLAPSAADSSNLHTPSGNPYFPSTGAAWYGVKRILRSGATSPSFPTGYSQHGDMIVVNSDQTIYADATKNGWSGNGTAALNFANTSTLTIGSAGCYVRSGADSISATASVGQYVNFSHATGSGFNGAVNENCLTFWANGGVAGGQVLQVQATIAGVLQPNIYTLTALLAGSHWQKFTIPLSELGVAGSASFDSFRIQLAQLPAGTTSSTFYLDEVTLVAGTPTEQTLYTDSLQNGWAILGSGIVNLSNTGTFVLSGSNSASVTAPANKGLHFHRAVAESATGYDTLSFWINGGATGGQSLVVKATTGTTTLPPVTIAAPAANTWQRVTIPLVQLGIVNNPAGTFDGIWIDNPTTSTESAFYVDNVTLYGDGTPGLKSASVRGLAASPTQLFVSDPLNGLLRAYDLSTMAPLYTWSVPRAGAVTWDTTHSFVWVVSSGDATNVPRVLCFQQGSGSTPGAAKTTRTITLPSTVIPAALTTDNSGRLWIADNGLNQQVLIYKNLDTTPTADTPFGTQYGIFSGVGAEIGIYGPGAFNGLTGLGHDGAGNMYVSCNGRNYGGHYTGSIVESYNSSGAFNWELFGLEYIDICGIDPGTDGADIYSSEEHIKLDYSKTVPGTEWSYAGCTLDPYLYSQDMRNHAPEHFIFQTQKVGGNTYQLMDLGIYGLGIYRKDTSVSGETLIPSVVIACRPMRFEGGTFPPFEPTTYDVTLPHPKPGMPTAQWIWTDSNGDGKFQASEYTQPDQSFGTMGPNHVSMATNGDIWYSSDKFIAHFICGGIDAQKNLVYSYQTPPGPIGGERYERSKAVPPPFTDVSDMEYNSDTDAMVVSGYTGTLTDLGDGTGYVGRQIARYDHWSSIWPVLMAGGTGVSSITPAQTFSIPYLMTNATATPPVPHYKPISMKVAGDFIFVQYSYSGNGALYNGEKLGSELRVYRLSDSAFMGKITSPNDPNGPLGDYTQIWVDLSMGINAVARSNGEYDIFVEEDIYMKLFMYRWFAPPATPSNLVATAVSSTQVGLTWKDVPGETSYTVQRSVGGGAYVTTGTLGANVTSYSDAGLTPGTAYGYKIYATNSEGNSGISIPAMVTTPTP